MKINIIYASRYGSTKDVSDLIAGHLDAEASVCEVSSASVAEGEIVLLGSGIYANKMLPEMEDFISRHKDTLQICKVGFFGVAMRTEAVEKNGRMSGGIYIFDKYPVKPFIKTMLHGRRDFNILTHEDKLKLERFYTAIGLSDIEKKARRMPSDMVSEDECREFAEAVIRILTID